MTVDPFSLDAICASWPVPEPEHFMAGEAFRIESESPRIGSTLIELRVQLQRANGRKRTRLADANMLDAEGRSVCWSVRA